MYTESIFQNFVKKLLSYLSGVWNTDAMLWFIAPSLCLAVVIKSKIMCFWWLDLLMVSDSAGVVGVLLGLIPDFLFVQLLPR